MRFKTYLRKILASNTVEVLPFGPEDYKQAGVSYAPVAGMPLLEAYELVNKWNVDQASQNFVYAVA